MKRIWSYLIAALCAVLTSARVLHFPGNRNGLQGNIVSTLENEKLLTPPSDSGLIIDSNGYPGNLNGIKFQEGNPKDLPSLFNKIMNAALQRNHQLDDFKIIPFSKEDIIQLGNSDICKDMCMNNIKNAPCDCKN